MITYVLKYPKGNRPTLIYLTAYFGSRRLKISTGVKVLPALWNPVKHRARKEAPAGAKINAYLDRLEARVNESYLALFHANGFGHFPLWHFELFSGDFDLLPENRDC